MTAAGTSGQATSSPTPAPYQVMPALSADEYASLRRDIQEVGVLVPVVRDQYGNTIDGHHRARIADELGINYRIDVVQVADEGEARSLARTYNLARRHLTREQKRQLIADEIQANPNRSDREIARLMGCDHKTVGAVRRILSGESPRTETDPLTEAERHRLAECTEQIEAGLGSLDVTILARLLSGEPPATIVGWLAVAWHQFELEHHGDEEFLGPVRKVMYTDRVQAVMAWPDGWYGDECRRAPDELRQVYLARTGQATPEATGVQP